MKRIAILVLAVFCLLATACKKDSNNCPQGTVNSNCICPGVVDYVCGCNGKTYENACTAACDGITTYTKGRCQ